MSTDRVNLDTIEIAAPCSASWGAMEGDDRRRFCGDCRKNVYDLSGMTRREAEELIARHESPPCVRFFRRADGTVLTADCPVGLRRRMRRAWARCAALLVAMLATLPGCGPRPRPGSSGSSTPPAIVEPPLMGEVCPPEIEAPEPPPPPLEEPSVEPRDEPVMGKIRPPSGGDRR